MDTPVQANTIGTFMGSPNHTTNYTQVGRSVSLLDISKYSHERNFKLKFFLAFVSRIFCSHLILCLLSVPQNDVINVGGELGSGDTGYFSTSPQMAYQPATTTTTATQQLTPQTPNTPTIILTGIIAWICFEIFLMRWSSRWSRYTIFYTICLW